MGGSRDIRSCLLDVRDRIGAACARSGRDPADVTLIGVTKTHTAETAAAAVEAGLLDLGENYAQELVAKARALDAMGIRPRWHFMGGLQSNKVRMIMPLVAGIQSVDRPSLADELRRRADPERPVEIWVEVSVAGEDQKSGIEPSEAQSLCERLIGVPGLHLAGLMCVPPYDPDSEASRPHFKSLRQLRDRLRQSLGCEQEVMSGLSMGMSGDFDVAIEEGATVVRVGSALFGHRPRKAE